MVNKDIGGSMDYYDPNAEHLFEAGNSECSYVVHKCVFMDQYLGSKVVGYGVYNKTTGVREAEVRRFSSAMKLARAFVEEFQNTTSTETIVEPKQGDLFKDAETAILN